MELKKYQNQTLRDLEQYISILNESDNLATAYHNYWLSRGVDIHCIDNTYLRPYINNVKGVPRVTLKVPTAGGKTFIACNAIKTIMDNLQCGVQNKVVAWFVPSDTILKQTLEKLQDVNHPYRQRIDTLFNHNVVVVDKESALAAQGISPANMYDNLTIFVLSAQSFIETIRVSSAKSQEQMKPRAFRENGNFIEHTKYYTHPDKLIEGADPTALIQVIAQQNPLVIVDESHNFRADLRVELLNNLSPRFILELTATPRENSNIISFVDAMQLKKENMVKLPVIVENRHSPKDVLISAIRMRNSLEQHAKAMEAQGGKYIRPIILFQAQPNSEQDSVTFDKIKSNLVASGIPEEQIKIKTANKDELKGIDLMNRTCPVRYIITVNALKEGWDCPFAYVLATIANKTSAVDVEQILGRILRQPHTTRHTNDLLNISYVFTSSNDFRQTVERIIASLVKAGFSKKDFRAVEESVKTATPQIVRVPGLFDEPVEELEANVDVSNESVELTAEDVEAIKESLQENPSNDEVTKLQEQARRLSDDYNKQVQENSIDDDINPLAAITPMVQYYTFNNNYKDVAAGMRLPVFYIKTSPSIFSDAEWTFLEKSMLTKGFDLSSQDSTVDLTIIRPQGVTVDLSESGDDYVPVRRSNQNVIDFIREQYMDKSASVQKEILSQKIANMIRLDNVPEPNIKLFVHRIIDKFDEDGIASLYDNLYATKAAIQTKIEMLLEDYQEKMFKRLLDMSRIQLRSHYAFFEKVTVAKEELLGIEKGLYAKEETVNNFEYDVISAVSESDNVLFWHRNPERTGFCINGFINHYPDFIIRMKSGNTVIVETKGDHLNNDDTQKKIKLGRRWADLAGSSYHYFMVFENKEVEGAITVRELLKYLEEL